MVFGLQKQLKIVTKVSPVKNHQDLECPHLHKIQSICFQLKIAEITAVVFMFLVVLIFAFGVFFSPLLSVNTNTHTQSAAKCTEDAQWLQKGIYRALGRFLLAIIGKNNHQSKMHF